MSPHNSEPRGWYSRGYLPHLDASGVVQFVTFRLADSLPEAVIARWRRALEASGNPERELVLRVDRYLDQGHGSCLLQEAKHAAVVRKALLQFDGERYRAMAWVIMPNHVHVAMELLESFRTDRVVGLWKSWSARRVNAACGRRGRLWQRDYFDRFVRDKEHLARVVRYIHENPVRAGLVDSPERWPFSSLSR